jgi:hypothetical protein
MLFPQYEPLDAFGPLEALLVLSRQPNNIFPLAPKLTLSLIAATLDPVSSGPCPKDLNPGPDGAGFNVNVAQSTVPTHTFDNPPSQGIDVLIVPGGWGAGLKNRGGFTPDVSGVVAFIREWYPRVKYLLSESFFPCTSTTLLYSRLESLGGSTTSRILEI